MFPIRWNFPFRKKNGALSTIGAEIESAGSSYTLPTASSETKGGVKIGSGLSMEGEVLNNSNPTPYSLPTASSETLGGVKIGSKLTINEGVLSADAQLPSSTSADENKVLTVGSDGTPEWATAGGGGGSTLSYVDVQLSSSPVSVAGNSWGTSQFQAPAELVGKNIVSVVVKDSNSPYLFCVGAAKNYDISASTWIMCGFYNATSSSVTVNSVRIFYQ